MFSNHCGMFSNHLVTIVLQLLEYASEKNFENRLIFGKDMDKTLWLTFCGPPCV